jgi:hypothetical protein
MDQDIKFNPTLSQRAADLRTDAIKEVQEMRTEWEKAKGAVESARAGLVDAVSVASTIGVSKEQLAQQAGVSASTIGNWLRGEKEEADEPSAV